MKHRILLTFGLLFVGFLCVSCAQNDNSNLEEFVESYHETLEASENSNNNQSAVSQPTEIEPTATVRAAEDDEAQESEQSEDQDVQQTESVEDPSTCPAGMQEKINNFDYSIMVPGAILHGCGFARMRLVEMDFSSADLRYADFRNADLRYANFTDADLRWANFEDASLDEAVFNGADASWANFDNSTYNTDFRNAELAGAFFDLGNGMSFNVTDYYSEDSLSDSKIYMSFNYDTEGPFVWVDENSIAVVSYRLGFKKFNLSTFEQTDYELPNFNFGSGRNVNYSTSFETGLFAYMQLQTIYLENTITGETQTFPFDLEDYYNVIGVEISPNGNFLAIVYSNDLIHIYEFSSRQIITTFDKHIDTIHSVAWSPDSTKLASGGNGGLVRIWDIETGEESVLFRLNGTVHHLEWNPSDDRLIIGGGGIRIINTEDGSLLYELGDPVAYDVEWSPDGSLLAYLSSNSSVQILDGESYSAIFSLRNPDPDFMFTRLSWNADGRRLFVVSTTNQTLMYIFPIGFYLEEQSN